MNINFNNITNEQLNNLDNTKLINCINSQEYQNYYKDVAGKEHYRLLSYISLNTDNSVFLDIGTFKGCSALAFSTNLNNTVHSFDVSKSLDLNNIPKNISFNLDNILQEKYKNLILKSNCILLDTFHDGSFEQQFVDYLLNIGFNNILLLDDIYLNDNMTSFWNSISLPKQDITKIGHVTGTGIVFFNK